MSNLSSVTLFTDGKVVPIFLATDLGRGSIQRWSHLVTGWALSPDVWPCVRLAALKDCGGEGMGILSPGQTETHKNLSTALVNGAPAHNTVDFDETLEEDAPEVICQKYTGQYLRNTSYKI